jgi:hypothetical protein
MHDLHEIFNVDAVDSFDGAEVVQWVLHSGFDFLDDVLAVRGVGGSDCKVVDLSQCWHEAVANLFVMQACFVCFCSKSEFFGHDFVDVLVPQTRRFGVTLECLVDF